MSLADLNNPDTAPPLFRQCCASDAWVERMLTGTPYPDAAAVVAAADRNWQGLDESDYLQAFAAHPKIGDIHSLKAKYADTQTLAAAEQSGVATADDAVIQALARGNRDYQNKFGFIFIVCASGKSAREMCELLQARLPNDRTTELQNAAEEQRKILQLRLEKLL